MECINHSGTAAAGTCQLCGKALCPNCLSRFSPPLCEPCLHTHNASVARRLWMDIGITTVIFLGVMIITTVRNPAHWQAGLIFGLIASCTYWGWQFLGRFSVPVVFTSGMGLITYLLVKFLLAMCFGLLATPWQIFKRAKELTAINALKKKIAQGRA